MQTLTEELMVNTNGRVKIFIHDLLIQTFTEKLMVNTNGEVKMLVSNADIEKHIMISGILEVSFMVSFKVSTHPITSPLFLSVYGRFKSEHLREDENFHE